MIHYQLIRSQRRRTLGLQVKCGKVIVRAPYTVSEVLIDEFVQQKSAWLETKLLAQQSQFEFGKFKQGSSLLYLGDETKLNINLAKQASVFLSQNSIPHSSEEALSTVIDVININVNQRIYNKLANSEDKSRYVQKQLAHFFKYQAEQILKQRLSAISDETTLIPNKVNIRLYRSRWGSCNNRGEVSFNYLLMMTPLFVIDYVIVHELCHLVHLNHSQNFWQLVATHQPQYKRAMQWLKNNQSKLYWQS